MEEDCNDQVVREYSVSRETRLPYPSKASPSASFSYVYLAVKELRLHPLNGRRKMFDVGVHCASLGEYDSILV